MKPAMARLAGKGAAWPAVGRWSSSSRNMGCFSPVMAAMSGSCWATPGSARYFGAKKKKKGPVGDGGDKAAALKAALAQINSNYGGGSIMTLKDRPHQNVDVISTGSFTVDTALGVGGLPRGRVVEIYGPEASGKTTLALQVVAEAQKRGMTAVFIDAEHALDVDYATRLGVDFDDLQMAQPNNGEDALEMADILVRSGGVDVIVIDSVAALVPKAELDGEMGDHHIALQARLMSQALRKITPTLHKTNTLMIFINQIRSKVGVMFGNPEVTAGGAALKFYSSVRLEIRKSTQLKEGTKVVGHHTKVKVVKNKVAPPFRVAEFDMMFGTGISRSGELVDLGLDKGLLKRSGAWYSFAGDDDRFAQGRDKAKVYLEENPEIADKLAADLTKIVEREMAGLPPLEEDDTDAEPEFEETDLEIEKQ